MKTHNAKEKKIIIRSNSKLVSMELLWQEHSWWKKNGFRLETGVQGITVKLSSESHCPRTCVHGRKLHRTLTLSLRDAFHIRHLRWFWRQKTSQFKRLCSNTTTCKRSLSHQVSHSDKAGCFLTRAFCVKTYRFALDEGAYKKNIYMYVQQNTECLVIQTLAGSPMFTSKKGMKHNVICTCVYNIYKEMWPFLCPVIFFFFLKGWGCGISKNVMTISSHVHNSIFKETHLP